MNYDYSTSTSLGGVACCLSECHIVRLWAQKCLVKQFNVFFYMLELLLMTCSGWNSESPCHPIQWYSKGVTRGFSLLKIGNLGMCSAINWPGTTILKERPWHHHQLRAVRRPSTCSEIRLRMIPKCWNTGIIPAYHSDLLNSFGSYFIHEWRCHCYYAKSFIHPQQKTPWRAIENQRKCIITSSVPN